ncbi:hypothetical protein V6Z12_D05G120500 [Gossypium hirsutum]
MVEAGFVVEIRAMVPQFRLGILTLEPRIISLLT